MKNIVRFALLAAILLPATGEAQPKVIGFLDGVHQSGLHGWACTVGQSAPVTVDLYVGKSSLGTAGTKIGTVTPADKASVGIHQLCQSPAGDFAYFLPLTPAQVEQYAGQSIYAVAETSGTLLKGGGTLLPVWWGPSMWYKGPSGAPAFAQGDFNAMFAPGAAWNPANVDVVTLSSAPLNIGSNPKAQAVADWFNAHPGVRLGISESMMAVGPHSGCVSSGLQGLPPAGTPLTLSVEGVEYHANYADPGQDINSGLHALTPWHAMGGRIDVILMDIPLSAGIAKCSFTVKQTVANMLPFVKAILALYPRVKFAIEQGPAALTTANWLAYSAQFFAEFKSQAGVPVSYADLDLNLAAPTTGSPPIPLYTNGTTVGFINAAVAAFNAAGVGVAANVDGIPAPGESQEAVIARILSLTRTAVASGVPFEHISIQPFSMYGNSNWIVDNLPDTSPSAMTWLLQQNF